MQLLKRYLAAKAYRNKKLFFLNLSPFVLAIFLSILILFFPYFLPYRLPLFYSLPWGDAQMVSLRQFYIIPAIIILINLINIGLSWQLHQTQTFFKKVLLISSLVSSLILAITLIKIIFIFI